MRGLTNILASIEQFILNILNMAEVEFSFNLIMINIENNLTEGWTINRNIFYLCVVNKVIVCTCLSPG